MISYIPKKILVRDKNGELKPILALKGDKGDKGDTYTITESDKQEIAQTVKTEYMNEFLTVFSYDEETKTLNITTDG